MNVVKSNAHLSKTRSPSSSQIKCSPPHKNLDWENTKKVLADASERSRQLNGKLKSFIEPIQLELQKYADDDIGKVKDDIECLKQWVIGSQQKAPEKRRSWRHDD
jgi:hypothetical protein